MTLIVDRMETEDEQTEPEIAEAERQRIDVTDLHADGISEFVDTNVDTDSVSLEHRGSRTYLVLEG